MTSLPSAWPTLIKNRVRLWLPIIVSTVLAIALIAESSSALAVAQGEQSQQAQDDAEAEADTQIDITDTADARDFAVAMLGSGFSASEAAAAEALSGGEEAFEAYKDGGRDTAQSQDLRQLLITISAISGPTVQDKVSELLDANNGAGDVEAIGEFIESGWELAQTVDDRATAWEAAEAPDGSALKRAADAALRDNSADALSDFAATGADTARSHDRRREVYDLTTSELPSVAAGAQEAIRTNTDTAIEGYLRYGQYVAAAQDTEEMDIRELVNMSITEANKASEANSLAVQQADQAARAAENARRATERARDEAKAADAAQVRAGNAAESAGRLASESARVADQAVAASQEARVALQQTADALNRAAAAAARARAAAAEASSRASAASRDAGAARGARIAAEAARDAADAVKMSEDSFREADRSASAAGAAGEAASSAASNADAAAAAASDAASAAGVGDAAAAEARAGAQRARAAAGRARAASNEVDQIVGQIQQLVAEARDASREAADHAQRSAEAADEAAYEAGNADYAARMSGKHADDAAAAAQAAQENIDLAEKIHDAAAEAADARLEEEKGYLRAQATDARAVQDAMDSATAEREEAEAELLEKMKALDGDDGAADDIGDLRSATVAAARVGSPAVAEAAKIALRGGKTADLTAFADRAYSDAVETDNSSLVRSWWKNDPNESVREASEDAFRYYPESIEDFIDTGVGELRKPDLVSETWRLRETAGEATAAAADDALRKNTPAALDDFVHGGGYQKARNVDQSRQAYALVDSGGPEVSAAAEAAAVGDRNGLNEFITIEQYRRAMLDDQRAAHDAQVDGMLDIGRHAAAVAAETAANARQAHHHAMGSANDASRYAEEAGQWAGRANESARQAQEHVSSAQRSFEFAKTQQARAHEAAASAEADANQAESNASQASVHAADARASASSAASSAASARASAEAAGEDADLAAQAANEAYDIAWQKKFEEDFEKHQVAQDEGIDDSPANLFEAIKEAIGDDDAKILQEFFGLDKLTECLGLNLLSCAMFGGGFNIVSKGARAPKVLSALTKLARNIGTAIASYYSRKNRTDEQINEARDPESCRVGSQGVTPFASSGCPYGENVRKINGRWPINGQYAGGTWRQDRTDDIPSWFKNKYGDVPFNDRGFPVFTPHVQDAKGVDGDIHIPLPAQLRRDQDFAAADRQLNINEQYRKDHGLVWHHHEDPGRMQLLPKDLHNTVPHTGGYAIWGGGAKDINQ